MRSQHLLATTRVALAVAVVLAFAGAALAEKVFRRAYDLSYGGAESLDPIASSRFYEVTDLLYDRLIRQGPDGAPAPDWRRPGPPTTLQPSGPCGFGQASSSMVAATSTLRMRSSRWSASAIRCLNPPVAAVLGIISEVEAVDPLTAKLKLSSPHAGIPLLLYDYRVRMLPSEA